jgi:hypothetical protein
VLHDWIANQDNCRTSSSYDHLVFPLKYEMYTTKGENDAYGFSECNPSLLGDRLLRYVLHDWIANHDNCRTSSSYDHLVFPLTLYEASLASRIRHHSQQKHLKPPVRSISCISHLSPQPTLRTTAPHLQRMYPLRVIAPTTPTTVARSGSNK